MRIRVVLFLVILLGLVVAGGWVLPDWWEEQERRERLRPRPVPIAGSAGRSSAPAVLGRDLRGSWSRRGWIDQDGERFCLQLHDPDTHLPVLIHGRRDAVTGSYAYASRIPLADEHLPWRLDPDAGLVAFAGGEHLQVHSLLDGSEVARLTVRGNPDNYWFLDSQTLLVATNDLLWRYGLGNPGECTLVLDWHETIDTSYHLVDGRWLVGPSHHEGMQTFRSHDLAGGQSSRPIDWTPAEGYRLSAWTSDGEACYLAVSPIIKGTDRPCRLWRLGSTGERESWDISTDRVDDVEAIAIGQGRLLVDFKECTNVRKEGRAWSARSGLLALDLAALGGSPQWLTMCQGASSNGGRLTSGRWYDRLLTDGIVERISIADGSVAMRLEADPRRCPTPEENDHQDGGDLRPRITWDPHGVEVVTVRDESRRWFHAFAAERGWRLAGLAGDTVVCRNDDVVVGFALAGGAQRFSLRQDDLRWIQVKGGQILLSTTDREATEVDPVTGAQVDRWQTNGTYPSLTHGDHLITMGGGQIYAWLGDQMVWRWQGGHHSWRLLSDGDTLVVSDEGMLRALSLTDGSDLADVPLPLEGRYAIRQAGPDLWIRNKRDEEVRIAVADWQVVERRYVGARGGNSAAINQAIETDRGPAVSYRLGNRFDGDRGAMAQRHLLLTGLRSGQRIPDRPTGDLIHTDDRAWWILDHQHRLFRNGEQVGRLAADEATRFTTDPSGRLVALVPHAKTDAVKRLSDGKWQGLGGFGRKAQVLRPWRHGLVSFVKPVPGDGTVVSVGLWAGDDLLELHSLVFPTTHVDGWVDPSGTTLHCFHPDERQRLVWSEIALSADEVRRQETTIDAVQYDLVYDCQFSTAVPGVFLHMRNIARGRQGGILKLRDDRSHIWLAEAPFLYQIGERPVFPTQVGEHWFMTAGPAGRSLQFRHRPSAALIGTLHIFQDLHWAFCTPQGRWDGSLAASDEHLMVAQEDAGYLPIGSVRPPEAGLMQQLLGLPQAEE